MNPLHVFAKVKANFIKDSQYLFNTLVIALMVLAIICTADPYLNSPDAKLGEIHKVEKNIVDVRPGDIAKLIQSQSGQKPVMLVFYASWCPYCQVLMPVIADIVRGHEMDYVAPIFVSLDSQPRLLSNYIVKKGYNGLYKPYRLNADFSTMADFVQNTGSHYQGAIPYVGFFSHEGALITDASGKITKKDILAIANQLKN